MQDSRINYVVVGAFVSAMVVAFVIVISVLAGRTGSTDSYYTVYKNVVGIKYGTAVMYEGYQIGQVESVEPVSAQDAATLTKETNANDKSLSFKVNMSVRKGWRIPSDSRAQAEDSGLLAQPVVDIHGGINDAMVPPGGYIHGVPLSNFMAALSDISAQFGDLTKDSIRPLLQSLNHLVGDADKATPQILNELQAVVTNLAQETPAISASLRRSVETVEKDILKPANRQHIDATLANIDDATANIAHVSAQLDETRKVIAQATANINKVINDNAGNIDESIRDMRYTLGTAARYVDDIAQNIAETSRNMSEFSRSIRDNPSLVLRSGTAPDDSKAGRGTGK